nr:uncharacterized protein LOC122271735 [Parasteatoda tepidariorum]
MRRRRTVIQNLTTDFVEHNIGSMTEIGSFCAAHFWAEEKNSCGKHNKCCHDGKIKLEDLTIIPDLFKHLLCDNSIEAKNNRDHIAEYNADLASFGAQIKPPSGDHIVSAFTVRFITCEATDRRMDNDSGCLRSVMEQLDYLSKQINPFVASYHRMHKLIQSNPTTEVKLVFMEDPNSDLRRYNAPTSKTEVAAIFIQWFILYFFLGERVVGIVEERRTAKRNRVTQLQYYAYRFAIRHSFSLHCNGKLFQQFVVDACVKTEGSRLNYLRINQTNLRIELYQGLLDALQNEAYSNHKKLGKLIILPSTFQGSLRSVQQNYQDAIAIVRKFGRPDLFITFTCNPAWPEILSALQGCQRPEHRPDIVVTGFPRPPAIQDIACFFINSAEKESI